MPKPAPATGATTATFSAADIATAAEAARQAAIAETQAQFAAQGMELAELRAARQTERIGVQINAWTAAGLVTPAEVPGMAEFMAALEGGGAGEFAFSAATGTPSMQTPAAWFAAYVGRRKPVQLGARAGAADADSPPQVDLTDAHAINRAAAEFVAAEAASGRTVQMVEAIVHVTRQHPR